MRQARTHRGRAALLASGVTLALAALALGDAASPRFIPRRVLAEGLSHVAIETPAHSRTGYLLRQQLDDALGRSRGEPARYNLKLGVDERRFARGLRVDNVAGRYEILLNVDYVLSDLTTGKELLRGVARAEVSYDSADAPYAGIAASQDGFQRAATQAAVRIRADLARWLTTHPG